MGDDSSLLAIHFGLKERVFHLTLLCVRNIGEVICPSRIPVSSSQSGICDSEHVPPLPIGSVEQTDRYSKGLSRETPLFLQLSERKPNKPVKYATLLLKKLNKGNCKTRRKLSLHQNLQHVSTSYYSLFWSDTNQNSEAHTELQDKCANF